MRYYKDENGKECAKCGEYKLWVEKDGRRNFTKHRTTWCADCANFDRKIDYRKSSNIPDKIPLANRLTRGPDIDWICKTHPDIPNNHYLNYRGHKVCRKCHFDSIVKANRERRRRQNNVQNPWSDEKRRIATGKRRRTEKLKKRSKKNERKGTKKQ